MSRFIVPLIVSIAMPLLFALMRRWLPREIEAEAKESDGGTLPWGVSSTIMCALGVVVAVGGFYALRALNHGMSVGDRDAEVILYPTAALWVFLPGFAAVLIPWLFTLYCLRRFGYGAEAARIVTKGNEKMNLDGERLMVRMAWGILVPVAVFTSLALPMRMVIAGQQVGVTHYAHLVPEMFDLQQARRVYQIEYDKLRDGSLKPHRDVLFVFADRRRLSANVMGDGGTSPDPEIVSLLLQKTGLTMQTVSTEEDIP